METALQRGRAPRQPSPPPGFFEAIGAATPSVAASLASRAALSRAVSIRRCSEAAAVAARAAREVSSAFRSAGDRNWRKAGAAVEEGCWSWMYRSSHALSEPLAGAFFIFVPSKVRVRVSRRGADDGASGQRVLPSLYAVPVRLTRTFFDLHPLLPAAAPRWDRDGARLPHVACGVLGGDYTLAAGAVQWLGSSKMVGTRRPTSGRSEPGQRGLSLTWSASPAPAAVRAPSETGLLHSGARLP